MPRPKALPATCRNGHSRWRHTTSGGGRVCLECERLGGQRARAAAKLPRARRHVPRQLPIQIGATPAQMAEARAALAAWEAERRPTYYRGRTR